MNCFLLYKDVAGPDDYIIFPDLTFLIFLNLSVVVLESILLPGVFL